jgi:hypothetical protein
MNLNTRSQILCAWAGILCPTLMFPGLILAGYFPPQSPLMTMTEVADFYQQNGNNVRGGMILVQIAGALYGAFAAGISAQMRRIEHRDAPALSYAQLAMGAATIIFFIVPAMMWISASFRPERALDVTQALHDMGWLMFVGIWAVGSLENVIIGFLIIADRSAQTVFPRWLGFFNLWIAVLFMPAAIMPFFKTGPFAWNGILAYWIPATVFGLWFYVMGFQLIKAARRQAA